MNKEQIKKSMSRVVDDFSDSITGFNVGLVTPSLIEHYVVDSHGSMSALKHIAIITSSGRRLIVQPYDSSAIKGIEKSLRVDHGLNTRIDTHTTIVVDFPPVSDAYRQSLIKELKSLTEDTKVKIRQIRKSAVDNFKKYPDATPQKIKGWQKTLQEFTDSSIDELSRLSDKKSKDLLI